jgi:hypothetical protein
MWKTFYPLIKVPHKSVAQPAGTLIATSTALI